MVQIEGYLKEVEHLLLYSSELNLKCTKSLIKLFYEHLSPSEQLRNKQNIDRLFILSSQQLNLQQQQFLRFLDDLQEITELTKNDKKQLKALREFIK